jgi:hypothetical protein
MLKILKRFQREDKEDIVHRITFFRYQRSLYKFASISDKFMCCAKRTLYKSGMILAETCIDMMSLSTEFGFFSDNPLHNEMKKAGILVDFDFYDEEL